MRRLLLLLLIATLLAPGFSTEAAGAKIKKVLPQYLDLKGRSSLSPSLYERDAYQAFLRDNPDKRSALAFNVEWKCKVAVDLKLRVELRGVPEGDKPKEMAIEKSIDPGGSFSKWSAVTLDGKQFAEFGKVVAWRVTLVDADEVVAEQKSFLWQ